jgi:hypothetical protein
MKPSQAPRHLGSTRRRHAGRRHQAAAHNPSRRAFLQRSLTLGGLVLLTGCSIRTARKTSKRALAAISRFNDRAQALLFDPNAAGADLSGQR